MIERDRGEEFSRGSLGEVRASSAFTACPSRRLYGGGGADILTTVCGLEALGYGCKDNGLLFTINAHMWSSEIPHPLLRH